MSVIGTPLAGPLAPLVPLALLVPLLQAALAIYRLTDRMSVSAVLLARGRTTM